MEEEQSPLKSMHVPSTVEAAEMLSPMQKLVSTLGSHNALGHLFKVKQDLFGASARRPKRSKPTLGNVFRRRVEFQAR